MGIFSSIIQSHPEEKGMQACSGRLTTGRNCHILRGKQACLSKGVKTSGYTEVEGVRKEVLPDPKNPCGVILRVFEWLGDYKRKIPEERMAMVWGGKIGQGETQRSFWESGVQAMSKYSPEYHRRSIRLPFYDYAQVGAYFVTICVQNKGCILGEIVNEEMRLNEPGRMVEEWWKGLKKKFSSAEIDGYVVMPNHFHGILVILRNPVMTTRVGAAPCGRPEKEGHPHRGAPTLGNIIGWFKTMTTNEYIRGVKNRGWATFPGKLWQRNYYEHVIRDEEELNKIREYIILNPKKWELDRENPSGIGQTKEQEEIEIILGIDPKGRATRRVNSTTGEM